MLRSKRDTQISRISESSLKTRFAFLCAERGHHILIRETDSRSTLPRDSRMLLSLTTSPSLMTPRSRSSWTGCVKLSKRPARQSTTTASQCHGMMQQPPTRGQSIIYTLNAIMSAMKLTSRRFLFLTYPDAPQAENALRALHQTSFGKNHTLYVNRFGDIEKYANMPIGEGELPSGWREKQYVERVSSTPLCSLNLEHKLTCPRTTYDHGLETGLAETNS